MDGNDSTSRRQFMTAAGGATAAVGLASLSGCVGILDGDSSDASGGDAGTLLQWVPAPGSIDGRLEYLETSVEFKSAQASHLESPRLIAQKDESGDFGRIAADSIEYAASASGTATEMVEDWRGDMVEQDVAEYDITVIVGSFDRSWIQQNLENSSYDSGRDYQGYTPFEHDSDGAVTAFAVSENTIVRAQADQYGGSEDEGASPIDLAESVVDAESGSTDRWVDVDEDAATVANNLESGSSISIRTHEEREDTFIRTGRFEGAVANGSSASLGGSDASITSVTAFASETDVEMRDVEEYIEESGSFSYYRSRPEAEQRGRTVVVSGNAPVTYFL